MKLLITEISKVISKLPWEFKQQNQPGEIVVKYVFQKWRETLLHVLTYSQTIYLANLDSAVDHVTSQSSERIDFYRDHEEAYTKVFAYIKFFSDIIRMNRVIIVSPDTGIAGISLY